jgi:glycosyltransferase involved in cell wall biosynthesis
VSAAPTVSVVIRCRDEARSLGPVLDAVLGQRDVPAFEVVALDSGSRDGTLALLGRRPVRVAHLPAAAFTYGRALNRGAALARGEIVVYLSAHCTPLSPRWLAALLAPFGEAAVVATFGRQVPVPAVNPIEALATARDFPPLPPPGVRFSTANGAVRRAAVLARPFDEHIAIAEDHLWACGVGTGARIVYCAAAAVAHSHPMSLRHWRARFYAHGLATSYARARLGMELPWGGPERPAAVVLGRGGAFLRLAGTLVRGGELRALAHLPAYALARTVWYARGVRDGARRERAGGPRP